MGNRFIPAELGANRFLDGDQGNASGGQHSSGPLTSSAQSFDWSRPQSATQRALVILIENGGIDLHIPQLVDQVLSMIPGASLLPDSIRVQLRDHLAGAINSQIQRASKELLEGVELAANRYTAASPSLYGEVVLLRNGAASYDQLKDTLLTRSSAGKLIDLFILTHGGEDFIAVTGGITGARIRQMRQEAGRALALRSVYMMNCVGASLNQAWLDAGAQVSAGTVRNNYLPEPTMFFFWQNWQAGQSFESAVTSAYASTVGMINDAINGFLRIAPIPLVGAIDARSFDFVRDSAPVIDGRRSLTINSDDLTFANSTATGMTTILVPTASLLGGFTRGMSVDNPLTTSDAGLALIKRFEGFRARLYDDPAGHCTIGYGNKLHDGHCDGRGSEQAYQEGIDEASATSLMRRALVPIESAVNAITSAGWNQNQFDALASLTYNISIDRFNRSTLAALLRRNQLDGIPNEIKKWTKARVNGQLVDLPGLVRRRADEAALFERPSGAISQSQSAVQVSCYGISLSEDNWDRISREVFGASDYDNFVQTALVAGQFSGQLVTQVHSELLTRLQTAQASMGSRRAPSVSSTLRRKKGMHGWGMAVDFDVLENPYVIGEAGEAGLDQDLLRAYDHIADTMLGLAGSRIRDLRRGRPAFNNSIATVYDSLRRESDALQRYCQLLGDRAALSAFLANEWLTIHPGQSAPAPDALQSLMREHYEVLGGAMSDQHKRPTGSASVDRPFAPTSGGGRGDPASGFLNLERELVLALTDAGLAWGAIDMGGASGDIQHFDCRLAGLGARAYAGLRR